MKKSELEALNGFLEQVITLLERIDVNTTKAKKKSAKKKDDGKTLYRDFVRLSDDEYAKLHTKFGAMIANRKIDALNLYGHQFKKKFAKYDSHYHTILKWSEKDNKIEEGPLSEFEKAERAGQ